MGARYAFAMHVSELANHFRNIVAHLDPAEVVLLDCAPAGSPESSRINAVAAEWGCWCVVPRKHWPTAAATTWSYRTRCMCCRLPMANRFAQARSAPGALLYALGKLRWNLSAWNVHYDRIFCFGPYQRALFARVFPTVGVDEVGYPRFDRFFEPDPPREQAMHALGLDPNRPTVVWLPTTAA
ncbi:MAG: hypothetical protein R3E83_11385 [Burkholderiaceae bacterium]